MSISRISGLSARINQNHKQSFNGAWRTSTRPAPYPHENTEVRICEYIADPDEPLNIVARNYAQKNPSRSIFDANYIYTIGSTNYLVDLTKSKEAEKRNLSISAANHLDREEYVQAVEDKIEIAYILQEQNKQHDKFLIEEGIREIYKIADEESKQDIYNRVFDYNEDMANAL